MIYTEEGLKETQEFVADMERSLNNLRQRIKPFNEQQYSIMAQGFISQIRQSRAEIEEYLGIVPYSDPVLETQIPAYA
jgi:hypothetical protein